MTPLHHAVSNFAGNKPALVLSNEAFTGLLLNNFLKTLSGQHKSVPIDGSPSVEVRFTGLNVDSGSFRAVLSTQQGSMFAKIKPDFVASFSVHVAGQTQLEFSKVSITVKNLRVSISVSAPQLLLGSPDYDVDGAIDVNVPTRQNALAASGVLEAEISRVEGALAYLMPRRIVNSAIATVNSINLAAHFTALELRGTWATSLLPDALVIVPSGGISIKENLGCPTQDTIPDLSIVASPGTVTGPNQYKWPLTKAGVPVPTVNRPNDRRDGFASLYAPKPIWEARFAKTMPGIVYQESDNGFIGYDLTFTAALEYTNLRIEPAQFGMIVDLSMVASGFAFVTVDVPCVGRSDLAYARFTVAPSNVSLLVRFVLSKEGKLLLQASIISMNVGDCDASVSGFSRWLALAGGQAAVVGFIIDHVLKRVVEHNIPIKIREAIKQEVNSKNFKLLDLETLAQYTKYRTFNEVTFSGDGTSVLVGLTSNG